MPGFRGQFVKQLSGAALGVTFATKGVHILVAVHLKHSGFWPSVNVKLF